MYGEEDRVGYSKQRIECVPNSQRMYVGCKYLEDDMDLGTLPWDISLKVDGVRVIQNTATGQVTTRGGEPVLPVIRDAMLASPYNDCELFAGDWSKSISVLRGTLPFNPAMLYGITPCDPRISMGKVALTQQNVKAVLNTVLAAGHEGIVLKRGTSWLKVVPIKYADIRVTGFKEGKGKYVGTLGSIETEHCNVSGMDDAMRNAIWHNRAACMGKLIQVAYREVTTTGKLRFPVFMGFRPDKVTESI